MPWWGWIILGVFLLGSELLGVDAAFYLVFIGFAAILTGLIGMTALQLELWMQWLLFAFLSLTTMVIFRERLYRRFRGVAVDYRDGPAGDVLRLAESLDPGASCRMDYRGTTWRVENRSADVLEKDEDVQIENVDGLTLIVRALNKAK